MAYNGWVNYETWNVALWIDNDPGTEEEAREMTQRADDVYDLAKMLENWIEEMKPDLGASMFSDLLSAALGEVDWQEIADHYWADREEEEEENADA